MPRARGALEAAGLTVPCRNTFMNNVCQAIELVDAAERCRTYIERLLREGGSAEVEPFQVAAGWGAGATEAPRGTLYHSYEIDDDGIVRGADIITPTAQNLANLEADMRRFAPSVVDLPQEEFLMAIERLVRAYDPCLSCSVH
jgi:sulfhydrogenase subunit alpha